MTNFDDVTRRKLLIGAGATAAYALMNGTAWAKAPMVKKPAPGFHRFKVGEFEVTVVSDGPLSLGPPTGEIFKGVSKEEMTQSLANNYLPTINVELEQNTLW